MKIIKRLFCCGCVLLLSTRCLAGNIRDVSVQINGKFYGLEEAVAKYNGTIAPIENQSKYLITIGGKKAVIDFSSEKKVRATLGFIYPGKPIVQISFSKVKPNTVAYFDSIPLSKIDKFGNSYSDKFQVDVEGKHTIDLRDSLKVINSCVVNIKLSSLINCSGKNKLLCEVITE